MLDLCFIYKRVNYYFWDSTSRIFVPHPFKYFQITSIGLVFLRFCFWTVVAASAHMIAIANDFNDLKDDKGFDSTTAEKNQ